jgi:hypothetical protein
VDVPVRGGKNSGREQGCGRYGAGGSVGLLGDILDGGVRSGPESARERESCAKITAVKKGAGWNNPAQNVTNDGVAVDAGALSKLDQRLLAIA